LQPLAELEVELGKFCSKYILLKDYLHDAADRLEGLIVSTTDVSYLTLNVNA